MTDDVARSGTTAAVAASAAAASAAASLHQHESLLSATAPTAAAAAACPLVLPQCRLLLWLQQVLALPVWQRPPLFAVKALAVSACVLIAAPPAAAPCQEARQIGVWQPPSSCGRTASNASTPSARQAKPPVLQGLHLVLGCPWPGARVPALCCCQCLWLGARVVCIPLLLSA